MAKTLVCQWETAGQPCWARTAADQAADRVLKASPTPPFHHPPSLWRQPSSPSLLVTAHRNRKYAVCCCITRHTARIMGFGQFDSICEKAPLPLCSLVGPASSISGATGIISNCYARNIEVANTIIFEGAASFMHIIALGMTVIMILHIRSKFTAVGSSQLWSERRGICPANSVH